MKQFLFAIAALVSQILFAQDLSYNLKTNTPYLELPDPAPFNAADWAKVKSMMNLSFAGSNTRYPKTKPPTIPLQSTWNVIAWRGEKINIQMLLWTKKNIKQVSIELPDLVSDKGKRINKSNISTGFVRYTMSDVYMPDCTHHKIGEYDSLLVEDPIDIVKTISVSASTVQPVWLSVQVPAATSAGKYTGTIIVHAEKKYRLRVSLNVVSRILPPPKEWKFDLDLWQHPAAIARVHHVPLWSNEHFEIMKPYFIMLAKAGQKNITTSIIEEPWGHQTFDDFPSLIRWIKKKDGSWSYDYTLFDKYVSFVMSCGINRRINCYSMIPWKLSLSYYDERLQKDSFLIAKPGESKYDSLWLPMLTDFAMHLKQKKWFNITSIAMDERPLESMKAAIALLKHSDPEWKIALAGRYHPEIEKDIYDYSIATLWKFTKEEIERRNSLGQTSTYYTSCEEKNPNCFVFSPPAEQVWLGWYAAAQGFTGYLRWAYNSWTKAPLTDARFTAWPAGDTYQIYPGPRTSIRFEKLIEGIQDYEKIHIIRNEYMKKGKLKKLTLLNKMLSSFEIKNLSATSADEMITKAKEILNHY